MAAGMQSNGTAVRGEPQTQKQTEIRGEGNVRRQAVAQKHTPADTDMDRAVPDMTSRGHSDPPGRIARTPCPTRLAQTTPETAADAIPKSPRNSPASSEKDSGRRSRKQGSPERPPEQKINPAGEGRRSNNFSNFVENSDTMEYANHLKEYAPAWSAERVEEEVARIRKAAGERNHNAEVYKFCYSAIDLTTLSCNDSVASVTEFARKAAEFYEKYPHIPNVASICIYPSFVETVGVAVDGTPMRITSVGGGFPASQTYLEVKALEVAMAVENGADEIDIVLNVGRMLTGEYDEAANEVEVIRSELDEDVVLKVIIESGALKTPELIRRASLLSMFAGADFVKTSTGKIDVAATPEAAVVMCQAIRDYYEKTGRKVGFKAAGGVRTPEDAALYYTIVEEILGREWLTTDLFRIGASSAANNLLSAIEGKPVKYY